MRGFWKRKTKTPDAPVPVEMTHERKRALRARANKLPPSSTEEGARLKQEAYDQLRAGYSRLKEFYYHDPEAIRYDCVPILEDLNGFLTVNRPGEPEDEGLRCARCGYSREYHEVEGSPCWKFDPRLVD